MSPLKVSGQDRVGCPVLSRVAAALFVSGFHAIEVLLNSSTS